MDIVKELKTNGMLLQKVPKKEQTPEICEIAIKQNPLALKFASRKCLNSNICLIAVKNNAKAFQYVPNQFITKKMSELAVEAYPKFLNKLPENFKTSEICMNAVKKDVKNLSYVSYENICELFNDKIEIDLIKKIVSYDPSWFKYMPNRPDVRKLCIEYMKKDFSIAQYMPEQIKISDDILAYQKSMGKLQVVKKFYAAERKMFAISIKVVYDKVSSLFNENIMHEKTYEITKEFNDFNEFYNFLNGNLFDAVLLEYDFAGIDLKKYNIEGAIIKADILDLQGLYDGKYYSDIKKHINTEEIIVNNEIVVTDRFYYPKPIDEQGETRWDIEHIIFFYISDIHLTHRVYNMFGEGKATKEEIRHYIRCLAREMVNSIGTKPLPFSYLLIAGDTSSRFEFNCIFYKEIIKHWDSEKIVVVSGNHELIDPWIEMEKNIGMYRKFFDILGINFLHNDLLYMENTEYIRKCKILHEEEILKMGEAKLREKVQNSAVSILGGIGFSGLNKEFNALQINYGKSFYELSGEEAFQKDIQETNRFNAIYKKLLKTSGKNKVIILTHTPKRDWNADEYNSSWIYLNGHNHRNYCEVSEKCKIYADNQIGYKKVKNIGLKYFNCDSLYDIFIYYKDGIHKITREQYINFNRGKIVSMQFNKKYGDIYMLKKNGIYMFMIYCGSRENSIFKKLYLLDGGKPRKLERNKLKDLDYYYGNLEKVEAGIKLLLHRNKYTEKQQQLSKFIKRIGGSGKIHGCIVDIDFFCHLYVNYIDGKVTPYSAGNTSARLVYKDLKSLLQANDDCKLMADNYLRFEKEFVQNLPSVQYSNNSEEFRSKECIFNEGKYIYDISKVIRKLQYCTEKNVVRIWNEKLFEDADKIYNQQIVC